MTEEYDNGYEDGTVNGIDKAVKILELAAELEEKKIDVVTILENILTKIKAEVVGD